MRFALTMKIANPDIPIEIRRAVLSYIKNALDNCNNGKYYDDYFKDNQQKDYCFSVIMKKAEYKKDIVTVDGDEIKILFSAGNKTGMILFSAFIAQKNKPYPLKNGNSMTLKAITNIKTKEITNSKVIFKTTLGGGLCVREHIREGNKDKYYVYNDNDFREKLGEVLLRQVTNAGFSREKGMNIKVNPIQCKKVVSKHYNGFIDLSIGMLEVEADPKVLQYFYESGIGSRKSEGFGMLELVTQDLI